MVQFNKMFVMLPVMFLARKLDSEDPLVVYWLRITYACTQLVCVAIVAYVYLKASAVKADRVVYVPAPPVPFADPNAKKKYTEIAFNAHVSSSARSLLGSTLFGICLTIGLHYYKGMVMGLAIQTVMAPLNFLENPLIKALFWSGSGGQFRMQDRIFEEKTLAELTAEDEVVDEQGNPVVRRTAGAVAAATNTTTSTTPAGAATADGSTLTTTTTANNNMTDGNPKSLEEIMLDTWDAGSKADLAPLMAALTKKNCNYQTKEDKWSPIMILAGLGAKGSASAIRQVLELGANPAISDKEGWNALHWAAFHGSQDAARELRKQTNLLASKDKEGLTPLETARKEGNQAVADLLEEAAGESKKSK